MLGKTIYDPHGVEGSEKEIETLGLLPLLSVMDKTKKTERVTDIITLPGQSKKNHVACYEIHMGRTTVLNEGEIEFLTECKSNKGHSDAASLDGRVWGTYMHGIFDNDAFRDCFVKWVKGNDCSAPDSDFSYYEFKEKNYNYLADEVEHHVDVEAILSRI